MSKEAYIYNKVNGTESYLAGIVEVYTETILERALNKVSRCGLCISLVSDVYGVGENNELTIQQAIKKRIDEKCFDLFFDDGDVDDIIVEKLINGLEVKKLDCDINTAIEELLTVGTRNAYEIKSDIEEYTKSLEWYLGKPLKIYQVSDNCQMFMAYIYIVFGILIIEYEEFLLMIGIGTND